MHGLDEYDSEARWYYPAIMRTTTMDPLCEKYYSSSPYAWCGNNPVNLVDQDGRGTFYCDGEELGNDGIDNGKKYIMKTSMPKFSENELSVDGAAYDQIALDNAKSYIKEHSSQSDAFTEKADIYDCFVEVLLPASKFPGFFDS